VSASTGLIHLLLLGLLGHLPTLAQGLGPHEIKGVVYLPGNKPAAQVLVLLEDRMGMQVDRTYTDDDGRYIFGRLKSGVYWVIVPAFDRYARAAEQVELLGSEDSAIIRQLNLYLRVRSTASPHPPPGAPSVFHQNVPRAAERAYRAAIKALNKGDRKKGIAHLQRALKLYPDYFLAHLRLGVTYAEMGAFDRAVSPLRRACELNPRSTLSQVTLGMSLVELGQFDEAIEALKRGKSLDPESVNAHLYLGIAELQVGKMNEAEAHLRRAYQLGGAQRAAVAHLYLASLYDHRGQYHRAADELEAYLNDVPRAKNAAKIRALIERLRHKK